MLARIGSAFGIVASICHLNFFTVFPDGGNRLKPFLSSTFLDMVEEREAVLNALRKNRLLTNAMEDFLATPNPPCETALAHLRDSDLMLLVIGFKAGTASGLNGSTHAQHFQ
jgi:hypothetical protein